MTEQSMGSSLRTVRVTAGFRGEKLVIGLAALAFGFAQKTRKNPGDCETVPHVVVPNVGLSAICGLILPPVASLRVGFTYCRSRECDTGCCFFLTSLKVAFRNKTLALRNVAIISTLIAHLIQGLEHMICWARSLLAGLLLVSLLRKSGTVLAELWVLGSAGLVN
jgi:hypothetical protein